MKHIFIKRKNTYVTTDYSNIFKDMITKTFFITKKHNSFNLLSPQHQFFIKEKIKPSILMEAMFYQLTYPRTFKYIASYFSML